MDWLRLPLDGLDLLDSRLRFLTENSSTRHFQHRLCKISAGNLKRNHFWNILIKSRERYLLQIYVFDFYLSPHLYIYKGSQLIPADSLLAPSLGCPFWVSCASIFYRAWKCLNLNFTIFHKNKSSISELSLERAFNCLSVSWFKNKKTVYFCLIRMIRY